MLKTGTRGRKMTIDLWTSPESKRNDGVERTYDIILPDKKLVLPSVTTILSATRESESVEALAKWEVENPGVKEARAAVGTKMHELIEGRLRLQGTEQADYLLTTIDYSDEATKMYRKYCKWLDERTIVPHIIEGVVYWSSIEGWGFAGSVDLVADVNGDLCIVDHKSSKKAKKLEWISDYIMQVSAYAKAVKSMYGVEIKGAYINVARENGFQSFYLDYYQLVDGWHKFYGRLKQYNELKQEKENK